MSRRVRAAKRDIQPDPVYRSRLVTQMVNRVMLDGKKSTAERIMYDAMNILRERTGNDPAGVLKEAVENVRPALEVRSRRVGGANYQVPVEVRPVRRLALAMRWLREAAKKRGEKSMGQRLANELMEAAENRGGAVKKRDEVHRMAEANKAFAHFRF